MGIESFGSKSVQKWLRIGVAAGALLAGGCDETVQTPKERCEQEMGTDWLTTGYGRCQSLQDPAVAEYCKEIFRDGAENLMGACVTQETGKLTKCTQWGGDQFTCSELE